MAQHRLVTVVAVLTVALAGCASPTNGQKIDSYEYKNPHNKKKLDPSKMGYSSLAPLDRACNSDATLLQVAFSGGGTRAAALAYGVLKELKETLVKTLDEAPAQPPAQPKPEERGNNEVGNACDVATHGLIYEIDHIRSVSGGSFTALAYGLYGDALLCTCDSLIKTLELEERSECIVSETDQVLLKQYLEPLKRDCSGNPTLTLFEWQFLKRDVQSALIRKVANPLNWPNLAFTSFGRSDLAAEYYDEILFQKKTYGDLSQAANPLGKPRPRILVGATEVTSGARVVFGQDAFASFCSELKSVSLARAAAASSAFPILLSPITLENFAPRCHFKIGEFLRLAYKFEEREELPARARSRVTEIEHIEELEVAEIGGKPVPVLRYLHLVDGGVSDNLGIRSILENVEVQTQTQTDSETGLRGPLERIRRFAVIVVNAAAEGDKEWGSRQSPPSLYSQLLQSASIPIDRYTFEQTDLLKDMRKDWDKKDWCKYGPCERPEFYPIIVNFDSIEDDKKKKYFKNLPTNFHLVGDAIHNPVPEGLKPDPVDNLMALGRELLKQNCDYQRLVKDMGGEACQKKCSEDCRESASEIRTDR